MNTKEAVRHLISDNRLTHLIEKHPLDEIEEGVLPIEQHLVRSIISQQLSTKAAATIYGRFSELMENNTTMEKIQKIGPELLRAVGLSNQKVGYVKNVAEYFLSDKGRNKRWLEMKDDEIVQRLTQIKGVGEWTVHMILIFNLNRPDVLPLGDLIVRKGLVQLLNLKEDDRKVKEKIEKEATAWRPYRSYVSRLMWANKDAIVG